MPSTLDRLLVATLLAAAGLLGWHVSRQPSLFDAGLPAALAVLLGLLGLAQARSLRQRVRRHRAIERTLKEHALLVESLQTNPLPFALYDADDRLMTWNKAYQDVHAVAFQQLQAQVAARDVRYADLVRITAGATLAPDEVEAHVAARVAAHRHAHGQGVDRQYPRLGWLRVTKFVTHSGGVAGFAMDINELKQREAELEQQIERSKALELLLRTAANTDALTELANRRCFFERAEAEFRRARRYGDGLGVIVMDIDHFKQVNDRHGHGIGDQVLIGVAQAVTAQVRQALDLPSRLGGEEFGVLLPHVGIDSARCCAERVRKAVQALCIDSPDGPVRVTVSLGVAEFDAADDTVQALMHRADQALYLAKSGGRNQSAVLTAAARRSAAG